MSFIKQKTKIQIVQNTFLESQIRGQNRNKSINLPVKNFVILSLRNWLYIILICRKGGESGPSGHIGFAGGAKERTSI
jgi:hypothetical protein